MKQILNQGDDQVEEFEKWMLGIIFNKQLLVLTNTPTVSTRIYIWSIQRSDEPMLETWNGKRRINGKVEQKRRNA